VQQYFTKLNHLVLAPTYSLKTEEERRRIQMVIKLVGFHLLLIVLAALRFLPAGGLPLPIVIQLVLNISILLLIYRSRFKLAIGLLLSTYVTSNFFALFFSDLTNLLYSLTAFAAVTILIRRDYRIPFTLLMVSSVLALGALTANNPDYAAVTHENVVMFVALGMVSILISTSVVSGDLDQIRSQMDSLKVSEARFRLLAENISDFVTVHTADARLLYASPSYLRFTGYSAEEISSWSVEEVFSLIHPDDAARVSETIYSELNRGKPTPHIDFRFRRKDGSYFWAETHLTPIFDEKGQVTRFLSSTRNITERVEMAKALSDAHHELEQFFALALDLLVIFDPDGRIIQLNRAWQTILGYSLDEIDRTLIVELVHPEDQQKTLTALRQLGQGQSVPSFTSRIRCKDGSYRVLEWHASFYEAVIHAAGRDITERTRVEEALKRSEAQLAEAQQITHLGSWRWDVATNSVTWSEELYRIFGIRPEDFQGTYAEYLTMLHPDDRQDVHEVVQLAYKSLQPYSMFHRVMHPQKGERIIHGRGQVVSDQQGNVQYMVGSAQDVTELKRAEDALSLRHQYLTALHEISLNLLNRRDMSSLLQAIVDNAATILEAPYVQLRLKENDTLVIMAFTHNLNFMKEDRATREQMLFAWQAHDTLQPVIIQDYSSLPQARPPLKALQLHAVLNLPIIVGDACIGVVGVARTRENFPFTPEQVEIGMMFSRLAALVVDNATQYNAALQEIAERKRIETALRQSEQRAQALLNAIPDLVFRVRSDGTFLDFRGGAENLYMPPDGFIGRRLADIGFPENVVSLSLSSIRKALDERREQTIEYQLMSLDYEARFFASGDDEVMAIVRNITERKQMEEALRESNRRYNDLVKNIPVLVYSFRITSEGQFRYDYLSPRCKEFTGCDVEECLQDAQRLQANFPPDENERLWQTTYQSMQTLQPYRFEGRMNRNGQQRWVRLDAQPRRLPNGDIVWDGVHTDITEQKENEERQRRLTMELQAVNRELKDFAYIVSHDLKVPLRGVNTIANWLTADYSAHFDDNGRQMLELLKGRALRMEAMINGVLEYSRVGQDQQMFATVDLNTTVNEILLDFAATCACRIKVSDPLPTLEADPIRMRQVFQNLIDNAVKYMDKPDGEISISCQRQAQDWLFCVSDNGPGIDARYFDKIFRIFQTLQPRDQVEGTGIGLTIVKRIIELYGGRIWVESIVGNGSNFFFTIPLKRTHETSRPSIARGR
jgi:two-component system, LuxR family, sensor kinase FixL